MDSYFIIKLVNKHDILNILLYLRGDSNMLDNINGAIFDLDGTLIDSMDIWAKIDMDYLNAHNISMPGDLRDAVEHLSFEETASYFKKRFNLPYSEKEIQDQWFTMALEEYSRNIKLKPGVRKLLELLKRRNIKIALATSNCTPLIYACLKPKGLLNYFDVITTTSEVSKGKSFPDIYLHTAKKLGISPENCIVFEDILPAIKGAKKAGMKVVAIFDTFSESQKLEIESIADKYIKDFNELLTT